MNPLFWLKTAISSVIISLALVWPSPAVAASTQANFDLSSPQGGPFPSDRFTVTDSSQNTGLRVELPKPDCTERPSDCADLEVINKLDGFNVQPRLSIPFDSAIDVASVTSTNVFLVSLGSTLPGGDSGGQIVGINQIVWDTFTNTLHVESDELLDQHTRYVLVVTKRVTDADGKAVKAANAFLNFIDDSNTASTGDPALDAYRSSLRDALAQIDAAGVIARGQVVSASIFTTQSVTAVLEKIRDQIKATTPAPADFLLGPDGTRTVFPRSMVTTWVYNQQRLADPTKPLTDVPLQISLVDVVPGVGTIAFGRYSSPDYQVHPGEFIPRVGTLSGTPLVRGTNTITFVLFLPSSPKPAGGYPVAIYGHGGGTLKISSGLVAAKLAQQGIATIAIDGPGVGFGPASRFTFTFKDLTSVTFLSGGRSIDQNGDGNITGAEGGGSTTIQGNSDFWLQRAADNMQLVREIEVGMDVDGDPAADRDLDPSRIYYHGSSGGGYLGMMLLAIDPSIRVAVLTNPGSLAEQRRLAVGVFRGSVGAELQSRVPSLINSPYGITSLDGLAVGPPLFNENMPLRAGASLSVVLQDGSSQVIQSPLKNTVPGAADIQQVLENVEWVNQAIDAIAYAPYLRQNPLNGVPAKSVIIPFANGDRVVPNPMTTAMLRAGNLADRATFVRTNLIFPGGNPGGNLYPHGFTSDISSSNPTVKAIALKAQHQIATFFASDGTEVIDPDEDAPPALVVPIFEVPIVPPLPEETNYFP
jgi:Bacterial virulence factor lipase N-terminal